jgi:glutamine synthetase
MSPTPPAGLAADFAARGVSDVECLFPDVSGYPRGKLMPASAFASGAELRIAQAIPMQCVTGDYSYDPIFPDQDPDVLLVPDYATVKPVPWASVPRALAIHDCHELTGEPCQFAPRTILKDVMARYERRGLRPVVAPEIEFYLTAPNADASQPLRAPAMRAGRTEAGQSAFSLGTLNEHAAFWDEFRAALQGLLVVADQAFLFKYAAKETALKHGMNAVFMAKPIAHQPGSSMHLHQSLVDADGRNVFSNADGGESDLFRQYIAGLQANLPKLMLLFAPFVNSYRRFVKGSQAPVNFHWGYDNRTAGLRIPRSGPAARRVENRVAGADANPYLVIAATLAAGLDGIERALSPTEPMNDSAYEQAHTLARTFVAAHNDFLGDGVAVRLLGERFVKAYASVKEVEFESWLAEIGAWERRYLVAQA